MSPDGKWLAFSGNHVMVWDTSTWQVRAQADVHQATSVAFTVDSASLILGIWGPWSTRRWDWQQTNSSRDFITSDGSWPIAVVSPLGDLVAVGYNGGPGATEGGGAVELYDAPGGQWRRELPEAGGRAVFSPDGKLIATGSWKNTVKLWNPATGGLAREFTNANRLTAMAFSPDARTLAVCTPLTDGTWLYDVATGAQRPFARGNFCCVWGADFSPDGNTLATAVTDGTVRLWDVKSGEQTACFRGHHGGVGQVAWCRDGKAVASGAGDGTVQIWNVARAKNEEAPVDSLAGVVKRRWFSRDEKLVAMLEPDGAASFRQWPSLRLTGTPQWVGTPLGFSPDDAALLSIRWPTNTDSAEVVWWSVPDFNLIKQTTLSPTLSPGTVCQLSPDGHLLATGGTNNEVRLYDLADNGKLSAQAVESEQDDGHATILTFAPDSRLLAAGFSRSSPVNLWDLTNGLVRLKGHGSTVQGMAFSPDGTTLFSGSGDLRSWGVTAHKLLAIFPNVAQLNALFGLDLSPDGKTLAATSGWKVQLWNVVTGREVARFGTTADVSSVSFAPDGTALFITEQTTNGPVTLIKRAPGFAQTDLQP